MEALPKWSWVNIENWPRKFEIYGWTEIGTRIQHKLLIKLMGYNYKIVYKKEKENRATDALSRRPQEQ
jgi:hypothetical protein